MNHRLCLNTFAHLSDDDLSGLLARGWGRVRVEHEDFARVKAQCEPRGIAPLFILRPGEEDRVPEATMCELGNECNAGCAPDWERMTPRAYADWALRAWEILLPRSCTLYVGAINNLSPSALAWLREVLSYLPTHDQLRVSAHRYSDPDGDVTHAKKGFRSLAAENRAWLDVVAGRHWAITEAGLVDAYYRDWSSWKYFGKRRLRTAADGHRWQATRFLDLGADFYTVYQLHDGAGTDWIDRLGIRAQSGAWKEPLASLPLTL